MIYIAQLRRELVGRKVDITGQVNALLRELDLIEAGLRELPEELILKLELQDQAKIAGGPKSREQSTADSRARPHKRPTRLTTEQVRDWTLEVREFTTAELQVRFGVSRGTAQNRCNELQRMNIIVPGARPGRWLYNEAIPAGPTRRPRGGHLLEVPAQRKAGTAVPGTGVPRGPAGTPGALRRQQGKAARVKLPKRTGVRP